MSCIVRFLGLSLISNLLYNFSLTAFISTYTGCSSVMITPDSVAGLIQSHCHNAIKRHRKRRSGQMADLIGSVAPVPPARLRHGPSQGTTTNTIVVEIQNLRTAQSIQRQSKASFIFTFNKHGIFKSYLEISKSCRGRYYCVTLM